MNWTAAELGGFLTAAGAALVLLVKTCFSGFSESRCETLKCCGCYITRKVKNDKNDIIENHANNENLVPPNNNP